MEPHRFLGAQRIGSPITPGYVRSSILAPLMPSRGAESEDRLGDGHSSDAEVVCFGKGKRKDDIAVGQVGPTARWPTVLPSVLGRTRETMSTS